MRSRHPEYSWFKAFWIIIQSGGDNDCAGGSRRNNHNARSKRDRRSQASRASSNSADSNGIMGVLGNVFKKREVIQVSEEDTSEAAILGQAFGEI